MSRYLPVEHPRFTRVQRDIFIKTMVEDCMAHDCTVRRSGRQRYDVCCRYGADVDVSERDAILARREEIAALLRPDVARKRWFAGRVLRDKDFPSSGYVRTAAYDDACVFLHHDQRGCAIHRAGLENGWDFRTAKPHVCRLFPLTYEADAIVISDDYRLYSCAYDAGAPTMYRTGRSVLADVFGDELVAALDRVEAKVLASGLRLAR